METSEEKRREGDFRVGSINEDIAEANRSAIQFALAALKLGVVLNGGALIVFPAYVGIFKIELSEPTFVSLVTILMFVIGLIVSWVAMLTGFFALSNESDHHMNRRNQSACLVHAQIMSLENEMELKLAEKYFSEAEIHGEQADNYWDKRNNKRTAAIILAIAALGFLSQALFVGYLR
jgi:hypothetical protein